MGKRGYKSIFTEAQWRWVADRYLEGYTLMQLANFLGVAFSTVWIHLDQMGVTHSQLQPLSERTAEFNALWSSER